MNHLVDNSVWWRAVRHCHVIHVYALLTLPTETHLQWISGV